MYAVTYMGTRTTQFFFSYKHEAFNFKRHSFMDWGCDLLVDYCDVFISFLDSHSDGTHSQHRNASFLNFFFWWINKRIYISDGLRANLQQFFIFEWTIPLKCQFLKIFRHFVNCTFISFLQLSKPQCCWQTLMTSITSMMFTSSVSMNKRVMVE